MSIILDGSTGITSDSSASNPAMTAKGNGSDVEGYIQLNCRVNSHGVKLKSPPHSSGQSYTMVLPDNQVAADKFLKVKSITGSGATAVGQLEYANAGIAMADQWRITSPFNSSGSYITSNWERNDTSFQLIGSGLTESSGVFSFPTTGIYFILGTTRGYASAARSYTGIQIDATQNNSSYSNIADGFSATSAENYFDATFAVIFDVPDVSTHKFKIYVNAQATVEYGGSSTGQQTGITVIKLGDT